MGVRKVYTLKRTKIKQKIGDCTNEGCGKKDVPIINKFCKSCNDKRLREKAAARKARREEKKARLAVEKLNEKLIDIEQGRPDITDEQAQRVKRNKRIAAMAMVWAASNLTPELDKDLDTRFQLFIRIRDAEPITGKCTCATCGQEMLYKGGEYNQRANAGHYVAKIQDREKKVRWVPENCHAQCPDCNNYGGGRQDKMAEYIDNKYHVGKAKELRELSKTGESLSSFEKVHLLLFYHEEAKRMAKEKGLSWY